MTVFNFLIDRATINQVREILSFPRYTRAELLSFTEPRIDSSQLTNWLRRDLLDLKRQFALGDADDFRAQAAAMEANEKLGSRRRYTGGDVLKCMVLNVISQCGIPFSLAEPIIGIVLERAVAVLLKQPKDELVIRVTADRTGNYQAQQVKATDRNGGGEWHVIIELDRIVARFLRASVPADLNDALKARPREK